jgi:hypothetical protein
MKPERPKLTNDQWLEKAVRENMWSGLCWCLTDYSCALPACIACHEHQEEGHAADCWLAPLLGLPTGKPRPATSGALDHKLP